MGSPAENWIVLCFVLRDSGWNHVDYLSAEAVQKFIDCTHEVYYRHFSEYFGQNRSDGLGVSNA